MMIKNEKFLKLDQSEIMKEFDFNVSSDGQGQIELLKNLSQRVRSFILARREVMASFLLSSNILDMKKDWSLSFEIKDNLPVKSFLKHLIIKDNISISLSSEERGIYLNLMDLSGLLPNTFARTKLNFISGDRITLIHNSSIGLQIFLNSQECELEFNEPSLNPYDLAYELLQIEMKSVIGFDRAIKESEIYRLFNKHTLCDSSLEEMNFWMENV